MSLNPRPAIRLPTYLDEQRASRVEECAAALDIALSQCGSSRNILLWRRNIRQLVGGILKEMLKEKDRVTP